MSSSARGTCFVNTSAACSSRHILCTVSLFLFGTFMVPTLSVTKDVSLIFRAQVVVRLLARSSCQSSKLCVSPVNPSSNFLAQVPSAHPFVIAFAPASTELSGVVAWTTLQCLSDVFTPPEVEHLVVGHPAPITVLIKFQRGFFLCRPTETEQTSWSTREVPCKYLYFLRSDRGVSHKFFSVLQITHFLARLSSRRLV